MSLTNTVAGLALGFATETGTDYFNDAIGDLASSGHELVSGNPATRYQSRNPHSIPKIKRPDLRFAAQVPLARAPLATPAQDLALAGIGSVWQKGAGDLVQAGLPDDLTLALMKHVSDWGPLRFYGEPLALLALLGVGGVGTVGLSVASLAALVRRGRSVRGAQTPIQIQGRGQTFAILADEALRGNPQNDPIEGQVYSIATPTARGVGSVTYGGPGSKYDQICEDSMGFVARADRSLVAFVFDGAGGSGNGFRATALANENMLDVVVSYGLGPTFQTLVQAVSDANYIIYTDNINQHGRIDEDSASMTYAYGTVAGVEVSPSNQVTAVGVGDSRVITLRGGKVLAEGTTNLHNYAQGLVDAGSIPPEDYYTHPMNNLIMKDVGLHQNLTDPSVKEFQAQVGDLCVIVSDGVIDVVTLYEIAELSKKHKTARALQKAIFDLAYQRNNSVRGYQIRFSATQVIDMPVRFGCGDNIAVAVVKITASP